MKKLFGKRIRELRLRKGLTQEQLATQIDIAERNISKIECGENFPRAEKIFKLSIALGVSPQELFKFRHFQKNEDLAEEIISRISQNPDRLVDIYKIVMALTS